jgi:hypothetical protein
MSQVSPNHQGKSGKTSTEPPFRYAPNRFTYPIWTEIAIVGLTVMFAAVVQGLLFIGQLGLYPVLYDLALRSWASGVGS